MSGAGPAEGSTGDATTGDGSTGGGSTGGGGVRTLELRPSRVVRWVKNFARRHDGAVLDVVDGALRGAADDGSWFELLLPFERRHDGEPTPEAMLDAAAPPPAWGVLLVRKGGFAVARLADSAIVESKVGRRHVQGRTKAGGQSQQRFARRRDNQAREAYAAAAEHAARILRPLTAPAVPGVVLVTGGDRAAVDIVLETPALRPLADRVVAPWLAVPDPRRAVLDEAVARAGALRVRLVDRAATRAAGDDA